MSVVCMLEKGPAERRVSRATMVKRGDSAMLAAERTGAREGSLSDHTVGFVVEVCKRVASHCLNLVHFGYLMSMMAAVRTPGSLSTRVFATQIEWGQGVFSKYNQRRNQRGRNCDTQPVVPRLAYLGTAGTGRLAAGRVWTSKQ